MPDVRKLGLIEAHVAVPAQSVWFDGHFPDAPVLPGIAQLSIVVQLLSEALGKRVHVVEVNRVRFKQAIIPGEFIRVEITPERSDALTCGFRLLKGPELACNGSLKLVEM